MISSNDELKSMKEHIERIEGYLYLLVLAQKEIVLTKALESFGSSKKRAEVYLSLDGKRSATNIAHLLGMKRPNVSIEIKKLAEDGLIEPCKTERRGHIYRRVPALERIGFLGLLKSEMGISIPNE